MKLFVLWRCTWLKNILATFVCSMVLIGLTHAFVVSDIKVKGLHRISIGTVFNYLPIQVGEELDTNSSAEIIRALYDTGFFRSVILEKNSNVLIVTVVERETVGEITLTGNKEIPSDKLKDILKQMGLVKGQVFQRSALERLKKELKQAYTARGKYNAQIDAHVTHMSDNRVAINISISEGRVARIKTIKFIGNHDFADHELISQMSLSEKGLLTYFTKKDQYSKPEMDSSLEAIRSFYLDRGYIKFQIISSQVLLSPDKKDVYIHIHVKEGPQYHFSGFTLHGNLVLPKDKMRAVIHIKKGEVFSRKIVTESISAIGLALGDRGYGFPVINAEPKINEQDKTVLIMFVVEPGRHVYVRRINFHGNTKTADYVLRQAIRQDEGALLSLHNIKESERQLRILSYLKDIAIKTTPVPDTNNQVDLDINVEEAASAEASASIGYGTGGPQVNASLNQRNFMGTGRTVGLAANASYIGQDYRFTYYNPLYTKTGVGRGFNLYFQTQDPKQLDISRYSVDRVGADINYNVPWGEKSSFQFGYGYQYLDITSAGNVVQLHNFVNLYGERFQEGRLTAGWNKNSYDKMPFPDKGLNQQLNGIVALPLNNQSLSYYKTSYQAHYYLPTFKDFIFTTTGNIAYGNQFNSNGLPTFENWYVGGIAQPGQVRGYGFLSLGPHDSNFNAIGGNFMVAASAGVIFPYPISRDSLRTSLFVDAGNVYAWSTPDILSGSGSGPLRYSAGIAVEWHSPFGPLSFSVGKPLNLQPGDRQELFQFALSSGF